jgi:hypothetical protein
MNANERKSYENATFTPGLPIGALGFSLWARPCRLINRRKRPASWFGRHHSQVASEQEASQKYGVKTPSARMR